MYFYGFFIQQTNWEDEWITEWDLQRMLDWGFNAVEATIWWTKVVKQDWSIDYNYLSHLDTLVDRCEQTGMNLFLFNRICWGNPEPWVGWLSSWTNVFNPNGSLFPHLLQWIAFFVDRYQGYRCVQGFAPTEYPFHRYGQSQTEVNQYHNSAFPQLQQTIRNHTDKTVLIAAVNKGYMSNNYTGWYDSLPAPTVNNVKIIVDGYGPQYWDCSTYDGNYANLQNSWTSAKQYSNTYNTPIYVHEFASYSSCAETPNQLQFTEDRLKIFGDLKADWFHEHGYSDRTEWRIINPDKTVMCPLTLNLLRDYAIQPIGGTLYLKVKNTTADVLTLAKIREILYTLQPGEEQDIAFDTANDRLEIR